MFCVENLIIVSLNTVIPINVIVYTLENLCTRTAQSSRGGHSRRVEKWRVYVHLAVEKRNKFLNILLLRVFFADYCQ